MIGSDRWYGATNFSLVTAAREALPILVGMLAGLSVVSIRLGGALLGFWAWNPESAWPGVLALWGSFLIIGRPRMAERTAAAVFSLPFFRADDDGLQVRWPITHTLILWGSITGLYGSAQSGYRLEYASPAGDSRWFFLHPSIAGLPDLVDSILGAAPSLASYRLSEEPDHVVIRRADGSDVECLLHEWTASSGALLRLAACAVMALVGGLVAARFLALSYPQGLLMAFSAFLFLQWLTDWVGDDQRAGLHSPLVGTLLAVALASLTFAAFFQVSPAGPAGISLWTGVSRIVGFFSVTGTLTLALPYAVQQIAGLLSTERRP